MRTGESSRTAEYMALFRALEDARGAKRLFADPFARRFLSPALRAVADVARLPGVSDLVCRGIDARWPGVRTSAAARTRTLDDLLLRAVAAGARQVILLGAGFDARAHRLPALRECVVFEVDHPATQARKRALLGDAASRDVRYVAIDFATERLAERMAQAGVDPAARTAIVWEGVSNYLTADAVDATLRWCATCAPGSEVLFTYIHRAVLDDPEAFHGTRSVIARLEAAGERWTFGLDPRELSDYLAARGLRLLEDAGASEYRAACYGEAPAAAMRGYEFYRVARASVGDAR